jgi:hypothetical protein
MDRRVTEIVIMYYSSRDSSVGVSDRLRPGPLGFDFRQEQGIFSSPWRPDQLCGPAVLLPNKYREAELMNDSPFVFMACVV